MRGQQEPCQILGGAPVLVDTLGGEGSALWCLSLHKLGQHQS